MMVVEDTPLILDKIEGLLKEVDREPIQILIEAKILEITLGETESFGLNWWKIFTSTDRLLNVGATGSGRVGVRGLSSSDTGFIFSLVNDNVNIALDALNAKGRVKTLSTPKILTLENKESSVIIGDRKGYQVTTTISQVTTTSVEFLESGVILKVTPSIDSQNRILLQIHPEVSSGSVTGGIPSQTTTEVNTSLLADNGQTIFIGGLLKKKSDSSKQGVPVLEDLPVLGRVFSTTKDIQENTETIVLITPYIVAKNSEALMSNEIIKAEGIETAIQQDQADKVPAQ
jgi:type II secretory pathway component GspD/PulD (secretin)